MIKFDLRPETLRRADSLTALFYDTLQGFSDLKPGDKYIDRDGRIIEVWNSGSLVVGRAFRNMQIKRSMQELRVCK